MKLAMRIMIALFVLFGGACSQAASQDNLVTGKKLKIVATTTIIGDVVSNIGGGAIDLSVLLTVGADPHSFQPTPRDIARIAEADIIFLNGLGLESFMDNILQSAGGTAKRVYLSEGLELLQAPENFKPDNQELTDPHIWMDPNNVIIWVQNIESILSEADPENAISYQANAEKYKQILVELDTWVREQVGQIPDTKRTLVTDHQVLSYFAARYGFTQVGALIPSYSTLAQPSAQELAALETAIRDIGVGAILVGNTVSDLLSKRVAEDTGIQLVYLYTDSLTGDGGPASTYLDYMHYNVEAIVQALK